MTELDRIMREILADPENSSLRLEYADHLDPKNSVSHRKAEFIRLQVALETVKQSDSSWPEMFHREKELLDEYATTWEKPLRDLIRPSISTPAKWLKSHLFGTGGTWGFRRGFIEQILTSAGSYLEFDRLILPHSPILHLVISHASQAIGELSTDPYLNQLKSLHLVSDMELDEEMDLLIQSAKQCGLFVLEFRIPRIGSQTSELFTQIKRSQESASESNLDGNSNSGAIDDNDSSPEHNPIWANASIEERLRMKELAFSPRFAQLLNQPYPASESEMLRLNEWIFFGDSLSQAGIWAVAKSYHDLVDADGCCRHLALFKSDQMKQPQVDWLRQSPYFQKQFL